MSAAGTVTSGTSSQPSATWRWARGLAVLTLWVCVTLAAWTFVRYHRSQALEESLARLAAVLAVQEPGEEAVFGPGAESVTDWLDQVSELLKDAKFDGAALNSEKGVEIEALVERLSILVLEGVPRWQARDRSTGFEYRTRLSILRRHLGRANRSTPGEQAHRIALLIRLMCRGDALDIAWAAQDVQYIRHRLESAPSDPVLQEAYELLRSCLLYTSPSPRDQRGSRMPSSA